MKRTRTIVTRTTLTLVAGLIQSAWAQSTVPTGVLEEIVITAQRRVQNQQSVPISVTALDAVSLQNSKVITLEDLGGKVPGLVVTNSAGYGNAPVSIRGIGGPNGGGSFFNDEPVAVYSNEAYLPRAASLSNMLDVKSLQVLRGPQGTLYGRNSTAGAILITTARPTPEFEGEVRASYASYNESRGSVILSGPLTEELRGRVALDYGSGGNYGTNINDGKKVGGAQDSTARVSLRYIPTADLTADLILQSQKQKANLANIAVASVSVVPPPHPPYVTATVYGGNPFVPRTDLQGAIESKRFAMDSANFSKVDSDSGTLLVNWNLGKVQLDSVTSYQNTSISGAFDADSQPNATTYAAGNKGVRLGDNNSNQPDYKTYSQELRFSSAEAGDLGWTVGGYYYHDTGNPNIDIFNYQAGPPIAGLYAGTDANFNSRQTLKAYAAFFDVNYRLTDQLKLTIGGRHSNEKKDFQASQRVTNATSGATLAAPPSIVRSATFTNFSPRLVLDYTVSKNLLFYASFSKGFKSGGFNAFDVSASNQSFPPEIIKAYEIGFKSELFDRKLRLNVSAFTSDYSNLQIRQAVFTGGISIKTVPKAKIQGMEIETTWLPTEHLTLTANLAYLDAKLKEGSLAALPTNIGFITYGAQQFAPPAVFPTENISGNSLTRAPKMQYYLYGKYDWNTSWGKAFLSTTYRGQSSVYFSETNQKSDAYKGAAWHELDLRLGLTSNDKSWDFGVFGQNVFDNRHITQIAPLNGFPVASVNRPVRWGIDLTKRFN